MGFFQKLMDLIKPKDLDSDIGSFGSATEAYGETDELASPFIGAGADVTETAYSEPSATYGVRKPKINFGGTKKAVANEDMYGRQYPDQNMQFYLASPKVYEDARKVCDALLSGQSVMLNIEDTVPGDKIRVSDFIAGVVCALNCECKKLSSNSMIISLSSSGIDITGDDGEEVESSSSFY